ncbi:hypothetical protein R6Q59_028042 [Mikania micrantha]
MKDHRTYGILSPGALRLKRKERESIQTAKRPPQLPPPVAATTVTTVSAGSKGIEIISSNKLLAGYMAYEFLSKGTLLGRKFDSIRSETPTREKLRPVNGSESYEEVTSLLMLNSDDGCVIPGIVNPKQLSRWIEM